MSLIHKARNWIRKELIRLVLPVVPERISNLFRHSLDRPFGNRYYQDRARDYDRLRENQPSWAAEHRALSEIAAELGSGLSVLDVPVGSGRFFPIYGDLDWNVSGLDVSDEMLEVARSRSDGVLAAKPKLSKGKATALPFPDSQFDVVVCFRFLQSIVSFGDAQRVIAEIARVSRRFAVLHLDVRPEELPEGPHPTLRETMRGKLTWGQIEDLLLAEGLHVKKKLGPTPHKSKNEFVVLCTLGSLGKTASLDSV